jgi:hypothetical protein
MKNKIEPTMKTKLTVLACLLLLLGTLSGCSGYEDGPAISFRSRHDRLLRHRKITRYEVNGIDSTFAIDNMLAQTDYAQNGFNWWLDYQGGGFFGCESQGCLTGSWQWAEKKQSLVLTFPIPNPDSTPLLIPQATWSIRRLSNAELWLETNVQGSAYAIEMETIE